LSEIRHYKDKLMCYSLSEAPATTFSQKNNTGRLCNFNLPRNFLSGKTLSAAEITYREYQR
jgi:hypothetical protein